MGLDCWGTMSLGRLGKSPVRVPRFRWCASLLLTGFLVVACQGGGQSDERLTRFIDEVMFGGYFDNHVPQRGRVAKWTADLSVSVEGHDAGRYLSRIEAQLERFSEWTGLGATITDTASSPSLKIILMADDDFLVNREHVSCYASVYTKADRIVAAEVHISLAEEEEFDHCLSHELMHAFGLRYHSGIVQSTLNPAHREAYPTLWDELALQVLYDARLSLSTNRVEAGSIIQDIVREHMAGS